MLKLGIPSKGRLMDDTLAAFARADLAIEKLGNDRGYRGRIPTMESVEVAFLSAGEIARHIQDGRIHMGVTGEDLVREQIYDADNRVARWLPLGFGHADVVVAVPACWIDVDTMADLEEAAALFASEHGRRLRVATKYPRLTRQFFSKKGCVSYRTVESLGATEGAPSSLAAEAIVDITSTGATLKANGLKILDDGVILRSQANLVLTARAAQDNEVAPLASWIIDRVSASAE
jgi:ATP phosphoribosyltransferase